MPCCGLSRSVAPPHAQIPERTFWLRYFRSKVQQQHALQGKTLLADAGGRGFLA